MRIIIFICISWLLLTSTVYAGSTALSVSKFVVQGEPGAVVSESLIVSNLSGEPQQYRFYPDEAGEGARQRISLSPSEFQLPPRQSLAVMVRFRQGKDNWRTHLNLVAYGESQAQSSFRVGDGIKIPVQFAPPQIAGVNYSKPAQGSKLLVWNILVFGIDFTLLFVVCYWYYWRHFWRRQRLNHKINFL